LEKMREMAACPIPFVHNPFTKIWFATSPFICRAQALVVLVQIRKSHTF
jgi:hypothetical protein